MLRSLCLLVVFAIHSAWNRVVSERDPARKRFRFIPCRKGGERGLLIRTSSIIFSAQRRISTAWSLPAGSAESAFNAVQQAANQALEGSRGRAPFPRGERCAPGQSASGPGLRGSSRAKAAGSSTRRPLPDLHPAQLRISTWSRFCFVAIRVVSRAQVLPRSGWAQISQLGLSCLSDMRWGSRFQIISGKTGTRWTSVCAISTGKVRNASSFFTKNCPDCRRKRGVCTLRSCQEPSSIGGAMKNTNCKLCFPGMPSATYET